MSVLFRFIPGFERVRIVSKDGRPPICFVDFANAECATMARQTFQARACRPAHRALTPRQGYALDLGGPGMVIEHDRGRMTLGPQTAAGPR
jgi:hypothetical protein